ncbi:flavohemoglobin expression-modulating QEGLA motif protein [Reichenbachiella carrageenanivorans]|uniref:Flavohemoglobin expression-modulating QEGLA motif protein n=1 Tax=Reichenbachiella carrageenanivorans TaxID=2979869 RepID=A0ABY6D2I9_9BACT|nr:flavohemoglobin expression-modulating QEGLA motif protein [Reichenbachiella carrageenanivorans]UXX80372.1 flavohemoglobin expression-modulating QEGLA motif protein [Reichenbachiella carrageenanivorans]
MDAEKKRIIEISDRLQVAASSVRILRNIAWSQEVKDEFFKNKAKKLPVVSYDPYDPKPVLNQVKGLRTMIGGASNPVNSWATSIANKIESSALLLSTRGTAEFFTHAEALYGKPKDALQNGLHTTLELAHHFDSIFDNVKNMDLGAPLEAKFSAEALAKSMRKVVKDSFGELAPEIVMDETLASNALAGRRRVFLRPTATFTDKDVNQLIQHELFVHVATSLNGYMQPNLKILREGHPGTTKTQEGLAVFAEFITGSIDLDRLQRLSDRVIAIQMAIDGASFLDVYQYYLEKTDNTDQSFESTKRVFRGGLVTGKAPFTKDLVYLEGLITVHNFLRVAISKGKLEYLDLLFCGKLDIMDLPVLKQLSQMGLIEKPQFFPPWIKDKRFLLSYLSYSSFLNGINLDRLKVHYEEVLNS